MVDVDSDNIGSDVNIDIAESCNSELLLKKVDKIAYLTNRLIKYNNLKLYISKGHNDTVSSVAVTNDNRYIVSGSSDKSIKIWEFNSDKEIKTLKGHNDDIFSVAITNNNKYIVSGCFLATIRVWEFNSGREIKTLKGHKGSIWSLVITSDDRYIISGSSDKTIKVWELKSGKELKTLKGHNGIVSSIKLTNDDKYIISGSNDCAIKIWELESGKLVKTLVGHSDYIKSLTITNDNRYIISTSSDKSMKIWDFKTGKEIKSFNKQSSVIKSIVITNDNKHIISGSKNGDIKIWDFEIDTTVSMKIFHFMNNLKSKKVQKCDDEVNSLIITNDNRYIIFSGGDKTIKVLEIESGNIVKTLRGYESSFIQQFPQNLDEETTSKCFNSIVKILDVEIGKSVYNLKKYNDNVTSIIKMEFNNYNILLEEESIRVKSIDEKRSILAINSNIGGIDFLSITDNGKYIISGNCSGNTKVWELKTGKEILTLISFKDNWIVYTKDGYYDCSIEAKEFIYFLHTQKDISEVVDINHPVYMQKEKKGLSRELLR